MMIESRSPMKVFRRIVEFIDRGCRFAAASVLKAEGSTPQKAGARAAIEGDGRLWGTIGGGLVDAEAQQRAIEACSSGSPIVFDISLHGGAAAGAGPICGGTMRILIDPTAAKDRTSYSRAAEAMERRERGVLLTTARTDARAETVVTETAVEWFAEEDVASIAVFPGAEPVRSSLSRETSLFYVEDSQDAQTRKEVLVEPVIPNPLLLIVGGGHVGQALARQAVLIGFDVTVLDDRPEFTDPALFPEGVTTRCGDVAKEIAASPMGKDTYVAIVTRGHEHDAEALEACIHAPALYIGMIGSKRKVALMRQDFIESGRATEEEFDRVHAPIGLDIGAATVPEIAASIAAQLIAVRRKAAPPSMGLKRTVNRQDAKDARKRNG